jgi:hypothetical protein
MLYFQLNWIEAVSFCRLYGMDLVSIESREEDVLITNHLNEIGTINDGYLKCMVMNVTSLEGIQFFQSNDTIILYKSR